MKPRSELANNLSNESEAYGYTLSIWGAGALLIAAYGVPSILGVTAYLGGSLVGFAALVAVAFGAFPIRHGSKPRSRRWSSRPSMSPRPAEASLSPWT